MVRGFDEHQSRWKAPLVASATFLGLDLPAVQRAVAEASQGEVVEAVNFNAPGQVVIAGHATSLTLEEPFWQDLVTIARGRSVSLNALVASIDAQRRSNLSSALRLFVRDCYRRGELGPGGAASSALPEAR